MPELLVPAFFLFFLYKYARTISSGVFFYFFLYKYAGTISSGVFFYFFLYKYAGTVEFRWENIISIYDAGKNRGGYKWI
jgi:hypothetical protein